MARIRWHGQEYTATPFKELDNGDWLMTAMEHGPRFSVGTLIQVKKADIVSMAAAEMPTPAASLAKLETAMAAERETLPSVREVLLANAKAAATNPENHNGQV